MQLCKRMSWRLPVGIRLCALEARPEHRCHLWRCDDAVPGRHRIVSLSGEGTCDQWTCRRLKVLRTRSVHEAAEGRAALSCWTCRSNTISQSRGAFFIARLPSSLSLQARVQIWSDLPWHQIVQAMRSASAAGYRASPDDIVDLSLTSRTRPAFPISMASITDVYIRFLGLKGLIKYDVKKPR